MGSEICRRSEANLNMGKGTWFSLLVIEWPTFGYLFQPYGTVLLDLTLPTSEILDWRVARVRLRVCDPFFIPHSRWIMFTDPSGFTCRHEVTFEIEKDLDPTKK